ncbi:MAG: hypothetical protein AABY32_04870 [Nanoarchaeota archaeon]
MDKESKLEEKCIKVNPFVKENLYEWKQKYWRGSRYDSIESTTDYWTDDNAWRDHMLIPLIKNVSKIFYKNFQNLKNEGPLKMKFSMDKDDYENFNLIFWSNQGSSVLNEFEKKLKKEKDYSISNIGTYFNPSEKDQGIHLKIDYSKNKE